MTFPNELKHRFRTFVAERGGLYFKDHDLKSLEDAIKARMKIRGYDSIPAYYTFVTTSEHHEDEFRELLNILTINHTYFFRNEPHFKVLKETILPAIIEKKRTTFWPQTTEEKPKIRIWSAGCSTGEEPYSIAMVLLDLIDDIENWAIEIYASDASTEAIEKAKKGIYRGNAMRLVDEAHREKYFTKTGEHKHDATYKISDTVKRLVRFDYLNLMEASFPTDFDIIFCRNVVIYFETKTTADIIEKFHHSLADDGYLFMGYSESLQFITEKFKMANLEDAVFYRKSFTMDRLPREVEAEPYFAPSEKSLEDLLSEIEEKDTISGKKATTPSPSTKDLKTLTIDIIKKIYLKNYSSALTLIDEAHKIDEKALDPYCLAAEIYANQGQTKDAKKELDTALKLDSFFAPAHYLMGSIYIEEGDLERAKKSLKKALYLRRDFPLAHFYLAMVYKDEDRKNDAIREYRNTLKVLGKNSLKDIIAYSGGFTSAVVANVCRDNIERLKYE